MPTLTIYIADKGARFASGGTSKTGHMWFSVDNGAGAESFGFAPIASGKPLGAGSVHRTDTDEYLDLIYKKTLYISENDYYKVVNFGNDPTSKGFSTQYNGASNSCIDFTYKALSLLADSGIGYEGSVWPARNINEKLRLILKEIEIRNAVDDVDLTTGSATSVTSENFFSCFLAGTSILMADGELKHIELIRPGDMVKSFGTSKDPARANLEIRRVKHIFENNSRKVVDLRGLRCTPGHVFLTNSSLNTNRYIFKPIFEILKNDGVIVKECGAITRARTGANTNSADDIAVYIAYRDPITQTERNAKVRAGILLNIYDNKQRLSLRQWCSTHEISIQPDETLRNSDGQVFDAIDWPAGSTPFDTIEMQNWVVTGPDGQPYTPPWVADLPEEDERANLRVVGEMPGVSLSAL